MSLALTKPSEIDRDSPVLTYFAMIPGEVQEYQLGQLIRSRYISPEGSHAISGINDTLFDSSQVYVSADAGGEGGP